MLLDDRLTRKELKCYWMIRLTRKEGKVKNFKAYNFNFYFLYFNIRIYASLV